MMRRYFIFLTIGYILLMLFIGLKPDIGRIVVFISIGLFILTYFIYLILFLKFENRTRGKRTIMRFIVCSSIIIGCVYFIDKELQNRHITDALLNISSCVKEEVGHIVNEILD